MLELERKIRDKKQNETSLFLEITFFFQGDHAEDKNI
jgi:hypothetical protein